MYLLFTHIYTALHTVKLSKYAVYTEIQKVSRYPTGWLGVPNLFFLHTVIPW